MIMKIVTHKFKKLNKEIVYLVNLVDDTGRPLESHIATTKEEKIKVATHLSHKYNTPFILHNTGFSIIPSSC
jgi:predicted transcriptional regulator YheO